MRENRRGRTGHDSFLLVAGTPGFTDRHGEVWAVHVGWSGNHEHSAERLPDSTGALGGGELLDPGEIVLGPGSSYETPWVYFVWSGPVWSACATGSTATRARPELSAHGPAGRAQTPGRRCTSSMLRQAEGAGRHRRIRWGGTFVLDDGWFGAPATTAGLGDWYVSPTSGRRVAALTDHVHGLGMRFGLCPSPMVNPDLTFTAPIPTGSSPRRRPPAEFRQQHVLT